MGEQDFAARWAALGAEVDAALDAELPSAETEPKRVHAAMRYSVFGGGKRVRPLLCLLACEACGGTRDKAQAAAAALEMIHTYSLIHDDLPAMDDDDFRRGRPSCHRAFDEATAILAGDALLTEAFILLARAYAPDPLLARDLIALLAEAAGSKGMVGGQMRDMELTGAKLSGPEGERTLEELHARKTGALLRAAVLMGGRVAGVAAPRQRALEHFGSRMGLAFQVVDDILDATADSATLGKTAGKDAAQGKLTYPALLGLPAARAKARSLLAEALAALAILEDKAAGLAAMARFIVERSA